MRHSRSPRCFMMVLRRVSLLSGRLRLEPNTPSHFLKPLSSHVCSASRRLTRITAVAGSLSDAPRSRSAIWLVVSQAYDMPRHDFEWKYIVLSSKRCKKPKKPAVATHLLILGSFGPEYRIILAQLNERIQMHRGIIKIWLRQWKHV